MIDEKEVEGSDGKAKNAKGYQRSEVGDESNCGLKRAARTMIWLSVAINRGHHGVDFTSNGAF